MIISPNISKHDKELIVDVFVVIVNGEVRHDDNCFYALLLYI